MDDLLTLKEFAKELRKPESTIRTWKRNGDIPKEVFFVIGSTIFVRKSLFNKWVVGELN